MSDRIGGLTWNIQRALNESSEVEDVYDRLDLGALVKLFELVPMGLVIDAENLEAILQAMKTKGHTEVWCNVTVKPSAKKKDMFYGFVNPPKNYLEDEDNDSPF